MKKNQLFLILLCLLFSIAHAEVTYQTLCFENQKNKKIELILRTYFDNELQKEIGALAKYNVYKKPIPLVYIGDNTTDESVDYELHWLEVSDVKITGEYRLIKHRGHTVLGAYVIYRSYKTNKETLFTPSGKTGDECTITAK